MGQRISYFRNNFNQGLKEIIFDNFSKFREWYLETNRLSLEEFNERFGDERIIQYLRKETELGSDFDNLDKEVIDEVTSEFIGSYCDLTQNGFFDFFGPTMSTWRYNESHNMVIKTKDKEFIELWTFLIKGRSIKDNQKFEGLINDYKIGFLTKRETDVLKAKILYNFENSLSRNNSNTDGLRYVLDAIGGLNDNNLELITGIE